MKYYCGKKVEIIETYEEFSMVTIRFCGTNNVITVDKQALKDTPEQEKYISLHLFVKKDNL